MKINTNVFKLTLSVIIVFLLTSSFAASAKDSKEQKEQESHRFFAFEDADYHTSPDKRIGAKLLIDPAKVGPSIAAMTHLTYLPGAHITSHRHVYVTEIIYVLEGNLTLRIGKETKILGPNSTAYIPAKSFHEYLNDSGDVVKFLQYYSPSGPEEEYRNWDRPSDVKPAAATKVEEKKSTNIVTPALPPVPGSPLPVLGEIKEVDAPTEKNIDLKNIDLKLKNDLDK